MSSKLRYDLKDERLSYTGPMERTDFSSERIWEFNHSHRVIFNNYDITLVSGTELCLHEQTNENSNLGALRNRQLRHSIILSAALSSMAVALHGRGAINNYPEDQITKELREKLKRANDRTAAQIMGDVLQTTTDDLPFSETVLIESAITEGARIKPGKELGANPTIPVGAVFGKEEHRTNYGLTMPRSVTQLSMGSDVVEGTTKSVYGLHSSMTTLFVTESGVKRHLPDIYVQSWASGAYFDEFNPREASLLDAAEIIRKSYGYDSVDKLAAFFLDRPRHGPAMDTLNKAGVATPYDKDGDMLPALVLGMDGLTFPNGRQLNSMIGEIGGSAEWAISALPLTWRGGQALGMLTSQSSLTRSDLSAEGRWRERFHYTEDEYMLIQDARFERKPWFTIYDIVDDPMAGGIAAFGAITDNFYLPFLKGVQIDEDSKRIKVNTLVINSLGEIQGWLLEFECRTSTEKTRQLMASPKKGLKDLTGSKLEKKIGQMLENEREREQFRLFFNNEYYTALIPVRDKQVLLNRVLGGLIERGAMKQVDRDIVDATVRLAPEWFANSE